MAHEQSSEGRGIDIDRRSVLKGLGASSAAAVFGIPAFAGGAAAQTAGLEFLSLTPSTPTQPGANDSPSLGDTATKLVRYGPSDLSATLVATVSRDNWANTRYTDYPTLQAPTISVDPNGDLYGIAINPLRHTGTGNSGSGWLFEMNRSTGSVTLINDAPDASGLGKCWGSAFDPAGNFYGLNTDDNYLYEIDPSTGTATQIDDIPASFIDNSTIQHTGLGYSRLTDTLWANLGDTTGTGSDDDVVEIEVVDSNTINVSSLATNVFTSGTLVGFEADPCADAAYTVRGGNRLLEGTGLTTASDSTSSLGEVTLNGTDILVDNVAADQSITCCVDCPGDLYYKYEWEEDETATGDCKGEFVVYDGDDNVVDPSTIDNLELVSVTCDESGEPQKACFETDYCELETTVKAGRETETETVSFDQTGGDFCVEDITATNPGGRETTYAISHVVFTCPA